MVLLMAVHQTKTRGRNGWGRSIVWSCHNYPTTSTVWLSDAATSGAVEPPYRWRPSLYIVYEIMIIITFIQVIMIILYILSYIIMWLYMYSFLPVNTICMFTGFVRNRLKSYWWPHHLVGPASRWTLWMTLLVHSSSPATFWSTRSRYFIYRAVHLNCA